MFYCAVLPGQDILSPHCTFTNSSGEVVLYPAQDAFIMVNGHLTAQPVKLTQGTNNQWLLIQTV